MQMVKRSLILMSILILLFMSIPIRGNNFEDMDLQEYVEGFHPGWNLGNSLDAIGNETSWGNPRTGKELIDRIADAGFKSIRIPVTWGHRIGNAPDYEIDEDFLNRVEQIVQWSLDAGLYVILNMHHETSWIMEMEDNYDEVMAKFNSAWLQISDHFKDYSEGLLFEALNEPRFSNDWNEDRQVFFANLDDLHISFHEIVRNSGGYNDTRPLMISTMTGSTSQSRLDELSKTIEKLNDKNLVATFHYYGYWPFSVNVAGSTSFDFKAKKDIEDTFNRVYETFVTKGVPVIIGEYGLLGFDKSVDTVQRGESLKFFEYVNYYGQEKKMPLFLWDNGQHFDRRAMEWR
ncbi:MAG: glycoside hydrolase family 5 protein, partial [Halanaerobiales bacterium]